jgi:2-amino-4-hydroxy-6-hydroxymethyldihydropteridine diphosphokinase
MKMPENKVVIALGSNIDAIINIGRALYMLGLRVKTIAVSSFESTAPIGIEEQPDFMNGVVLVTTDLTREQLDLELKAIEDEMGRDRSVPKYGPRVIDLDIIIWNDAVVDKDFYERDFLRRAVEEVTNFI